MTNLEWMAQEHIPVSRLRFAREDNRCMGYVLLQSEDTRSYKVVMWVQLIIDNGKKINTDPGSDWILTWLGYEHNDERTMG